MKIIDSDMFMSSSRTYLEKNEEKESLRIWVGRDRGAGVAAADHITISPDAVLSLQESSCGSECDELAVDADQETSLRKLIVEILSGREVRLVRVRKADECSLEESVRNRPQEGNQRTGWGMEYDYRHTHHEKEEVLFQVKGIIKTADGKEVAFVLDLDMNREFTEENSLNIRMGDAAIDPLVINFDGRAADLSSVRFEFDLDSDGESEDVPVPTKGSGFLAIDLNNDGIINNGSELFGPSTGNGFGELAAHDTDANSWIDENDEVFPRLRIMTVDSLGVQNLSPVKDLGIGALYLGMAPTRFDIRSVPADNLLGQILSTGVYLREDGTPGAIQQLNLMA